MLGREVVALNGRRVGRLEEFRAREDGSGRMVCEYVLGAAGLLERLGVGARMILGLAPRGYVVRWNQLAVTEAGPLRLTCRVAELHERA